MNKETHDDLSIGSRQKIYLILVFVSLILLFYSAWQVKPVIVEAEAPLGLASYLAPSYWIGLALLVVTSTFAFLDRRLKKDAIFITILVALGLFLLGITVFVYENAVDPTAYAPNAWVYNLLATGHLDIADPFGLATYYTWPAMHFISASLIEVTGLDLIPFMKYSPLLWSLYLPFITYGIGKRLELEPNRCFLMSFLTISPWLVTFAGYYYARLPATVMFLLIFMLLLNPRRTSAEAVAVILMFTALVITHGLTSLSVIPGLTLVAIYRRDYGFLALFTVILGAWVMYEASPALEAGIQGFTTLLRNIFEAAWMGGYQGTASTARFVTRYSEVSYIALYAALMIGSIILLVRRRIAGARRREVITLFCWAIGVALLVFWGHGELLFRTYLYSLVPAACIIALSYSGRKLLIPLMWIFVTLSPLANYGAQADWGQVLTTELKGTEFFALEVKPRESYFYGYGEQLIIYNDTNLVTGPLYGFPVVSVSPDEVDLSALDRSRYVLMSKLATERQMFLWLETPYDAWPQTEVGRMADLIYNNGYFQIYVNRVVQ